MPHAVPRRVMPETLIGQNIILACHSDKANAKRGTGSGPIEPLLTYCRERKVPWFFLIEQPHPNVPGPLDCTMEVYREGVLIATHASSRWRFLYDIPPARRTCRTYLRLKFRDALSLWDFFGVIRNEYSAALPAKCFIGVECVNALIARFLAPRASVNAVIYYLFDWSPKRYHNPVLNAAYVALDRLACRFSDFTWNITPAIEESRRDDLKYSPRDLHAQITVLYGAEFRGNLVQPFDRLNPFRIVFSGGIHRDNGGHLLPEIALRLQRSNPRIQLVVAGDGPQMPLVRSEAKRMDLRNLVLLGHIGDPEEIDRLQCQSLIGLAPYPDTPTTTKRWGDVIKIRSYFACGLSVVTTRIPPVHREIEAEGLGIVTDESPEALADAILRLCQDEALLRKCRDAVIKKAKAHSWENQFDNAFRRMADIQGVP